MKVRVIKPHTHAGEVLPVGEVVDLPERVVRLMVRYGSGEIVKRRRKRAQKAQ